MEEVTGKTIIIDEPGELEKGKQILTYPSQVSRKEFLKSQSLPKTLSHVGEVYYPSWFIFIKVSMRRLGLGPREVYLEFMIDGLNGNGSRFVARHEMSPRNIWVNKFIVIESTITEEEAIEEALKLSQKIIMKKYRTWWQPDFIIRHSLCIHIKHWLAKEGERGRTYYCNTITGDIEKTEVLPE